MSCYDVFVTAYITDTFRLGFQVGQLNPDLLNALFSKNIFRWGLGKRHISGGRHISSLTYQVSCQEYYNVDNT